MNITGEQYRRLQQALLSAFNRSELEELLMFRLNESLDAIVGASDLTSTVFQLIRWAQARGRLSELIAAARAENPNNDMLRAVAEELAQSAARPADDTRAAAGPLRYGDIFATYEDRMKALLSRLTPAHPSYAEALTYQQRLIESIAASRRYGDTETTRAERARVIDQLNRLALEALGMSFNQLT